MGYNSGKKVMRLDFFNTLNMKQIIKINLKKSIFEIKQ